jgi:hypothetical protein
LEWTKVLILHCPQRSLVVIVATAEAYPFVFTVDTLDCTLVILAAIWRFVNKEQRLGDSFSTAILIPSQSKFLAIPFMTRRHAELDFLVITLHAPLGRQTK